LEIIGGLFFPKVIKGSFLEELSLRGIGFPLGGFGPYPGKLKAGNVGEFNSLGRLFFPKNSRLGY